MSNIYKRLRLWFHLKTAPKPIQVRVIDRASSRLRLHEWRASEPMVIAAMKLGTMSEFQMLMDMARNESPGLQMFMPGATLELRAIQQAKAEGYQMCLQVIADAAKIDRIIEMPEPTFEAPEEPIAPK